MMLLLDALRPDGHLAPGNAPPAAASLISCACELPSPVAILRRVSPAPRLFASSRPEVHAAPHRERYIYLHEQIGWWAVEHHLACPRTLERPRLSLSLSSSARLCGWPAAL
jgi:hypothetical protein